MEKSLVKAVQFVREARKNQLSKNPVNTMDVVKECKVSNNYPTYLRKAGVLTKDGWNQQNLTDHDLGVYLVRLMRDSAKLKASELDYSISGVARNVAAKKPVKKQAKKVVSPAKAKARKEEVKTIKYAYKVLGVTIMTRELIK
jgi:hypothetical protein